jgi:hypothetical protein
MSKQTLQRAGSRLLLLPLQQMLQLPKGKRHQLGQMGHSNP